MTYTINIKISCEGPNTSLYKSHFSLLNAKIIRIAPKCKSFFTICISVKFSTKLNTFYKCHITQDGPFYTHFGVTNNDFKI